MALEAPSITKTCEDTCQEMNLQERLREKNTCESETTRERLKVEREVVREGIFIFATIGLLVIMQELHSCVMLGASLGFPHL